MMAKRHRHLAKIVLTSQHSGVFGPAGVHLMKLKVLAILAASLTISTGASANLLVDFDTPAFTFGGAFTTQYTQVFAQDGQSMYPEATVAIGSNPSAFHNLFVNIANNPTGNMLLVNGATQTGSGNTPLSVLTYTTSSAAGNYVFNAGLMNICCQDTFNGDAGSQVLFQISYNGGSTWNTVGGGSTTPGNVGNLQAMAPIAFLAANPFIFRIIDDLTAAGGNDFAIDNLSLDARAVPGPIVGAGIPGLVIALGGLVALARRRRNQGVVA